MHMLWQSVEVHRRCRLCTSEQLPVLRRVTVGYELQACKLLQPKRRIMQTRVTESTLVSDSMEIVCSALSP